MKGDGGKGCEGRWGKRMWRGENGWWSYKIILKTMLMERAESNPPWEKRWGLVFFPEFLADDNVHKKYRNNIKSSNLGYLVPQYGDKYCKNLAFFVSYRL